MKMYKKLLSFSLVFVLLLTLVLTSCNNENNVPIDTQNTQGETETNGPEEPVEIDYKDFLPNVSYNYEDVNFLVLDGRQEQFYADEENLKTPVDEKIFERNSYIEETYKVYLNFEKKALPADFISVCSQAGSHDYDILAPDYYYGVETTGALVDLCTLSELHLENPYWVEGWNKNATVNGKMFMGVSFLTYDPVRQAMVTFYNGEIVNSLGLGDLYDLVESGNWTLEQMLTMMEKNTYNLDSNDNMTFADSFGLGYNIWAGRALLWGAGLSLAKYEADEVEFTLRAEQNIKIHETVYSMLKDNNFSYYTGNANVASATGDLKLFKEGRALFEVHALRFSAEFSSTMQDYGVLPLPKYNAEQEDYITSLLGTVIFGIMKTCDDVSRAANILEAMSILSYVDILPVYYEDMLKFNYQTDAKSSAMLDKIRECIQVDFTFINSNSFNSLADSPFGLIATNQKGKYVSTMETKETALPGLLEQFMKVYE